MARWLRGNMEAEAQQLWAILGGIWTIDFFQQPHYNGENNDDLLVQGEHMKCRCFNVTLPSKTDRNENKVFRWVEWLTLPTCDTTVHNCSVSTTGHKTWHSNNIISKPDHVTYLFNPELFSSEALLHENPSTFHVFTPYCVQKNYRSNLILITTSRFKYKFLQSISGYKT